MEAVAVVVREISTGKLKPILVIFTTWSISKAFVVQTQDFEKILQKSTRRITDDLEVVLLWFVRYQPVN